MGQYDLVVIGGVAAGMSAASQARRANASMTIGVFERGDSVSYAACGLPYFIGGEITDAARLIAIDVDEFIHKRKIDIHFRSEVGRVDFDARKVFVRQDGQMREYSYGNLVIATGARAVVPPIPGLDGENVFTLRNLDDGVRIKKFLDERKPSSGILVGGGFIGLEMAEALRGRGVDCLIVEKMESVAMTMDPEVRALVADSLVRNGVQIETGVDLVRVERQGRRLRLVTGGGSVHEADFMVVSAGVAPATDFLRGSGLTMTERGAIVVNAKSETGIPGVYSAGDCATVRHLVTGADVYMPLGTTSNKQGRVAGLQAAGVSGEVFAGVVGSQMVRVFDLEVARTGIDEAEAKKYGIPLESASAKWHDIAGYCPDSRPIFMKLFIDARNRKLVGAQTAGENGAALRVNVAATAITAGMTIDEFAYLDLGYAPPFSPVWDVLLVAAQKLVKR